MGYSVSWLAVSGKAPQALFRELGIAPTGEMAAYGESMIAGRTLPNGWFLLVIDRCDHKFIMPESLRSISSACEAVACSIEEHVMFCSSELWRNGVQVWRIEHDAQKSIEHISTSGQLPDDYAAIEKESAEQQKQAGGMKADTDYFLKFRYRQPGAWWASNTTRRASTTKALRYLKATRLRRSQTNFPLASESNGGNCGDAAQAGGRPRFLRSPGAAR